MMVKTKEGKQGGRVDGGGHSEGNIDGGKKKGGERIMEIRINAQLRRKE